MFENSPKSHNWKLYTLLLLGLVLLFGGVYALESGYIQINPTALGGIAAAIITILVGIVGLIFYLIPSLIAAGNKHPNQNAIIVLNLLLGWTFIGWVIALVWSFTANQTAEIINQPKNGYFCQHCKNFNSMNNKYCGSCGLQNLV